MSVRILYDQPSAQFSPGDEISGKVVLVVDREKQILGLNMNILGKVKVTCIHGDRAVSRGSHRRLSSHQHSDKYFILKESKCLNRNDDGNDSVDDHRLPIGTYEYPFTWALPENIPASFEGPYGWIRYRMEVVVRYSFWDHRCEAESEFHVTGFYDLNYLDHKYRTVQVENKWLNLYNAYGSTYLELTFELERRAQVPGEQVKFAATVDFRNPCGHPPIRGVRVALIQEQTYRIKDKVKRYFSKMHEIHGPMVFSNVIEVWNGSMTVLPIPPTALGGPCRLIDVQYYLRANLSISDNDKIDIAMKLQIGTVPIRRRRRRPLLPPSSPSSPTPLAQEDEFRMSSVDESNVDPEITPADDPTLVDNVNNDAGLSNLLNFLSVPTTSSRRSSAPSLVEDATNGEPIAGPSRPSAPPTIDYGGRESPPPSYTDAVFLGSTGFLQPSPNNADDDDAPPEYPRQPPFFLRKGAKHLFDSHNVYSTL